MLNSMFDQLSGAIARRRFMPKRIVLDLADAREKKIAVIELPAGSYAFALSDDGEGATRLTLEEGGLVRALATFDDPLLAREALRAVKVATLRPFRKIVAGAAGVLFILFVCDAALGPRGMPTPPTTNATASGLGAPAQSFRGAGMGAQPALTAPSAATPAGSSQSSPEVAEAIRMLKGE